jgi:alkylhydroperoxidase/carboxymuconolactone decarboxylase family protein YurZ
MREMFGASFVQPIIERAEGGGRGAAMASAVLDDCFGGVWARPGLDRPARSLVTIAILIAVRQPAELKNHFRGALANGVTPAELEELIIHATAYLGYPVNGFAMDALGRALDEDSAHGEASQPAEPAR